MKGFVLAVFRGNYSGQYHFGDEQQNGQKKMYKNKQTISLHETVTCIDELLHGSPTCACVANALEKTAKPKHMEAFQAQSFLPKTDLYL